MKTIRIHSKDETQSAYIHYVEPEDINSITYNISSYIQESSDILTDMMQSYVTYMSKRTNDIYDYIDENLSSEFEEVYSRIYDLSVDFTHRVSYTLESSETDMKIINDLNEVDTRLSYAIRNCNINLNTKNSYLTSYIGNLTNYITNEINNIYNIAPTDYWENY